MNARYQKNTGPAGKTRRSASAAKPKREAGGQGTSAPKKKPGQRPTLREAFRNQPSTPEMKRWRKIWWAVLGLAFVVATTAAFVPAVRNNPPLAIGLTAVYLVSLASAFYIDMRIIRRLRATAVAEAKAADKKGR